MRKTPQPVLVRELTRVEMDFAIARWTRMNEIDEPQAALIENTFEQDVHSGRYLVRPVEFTHYRRAEKFVSAGKTVLRTLDALCPCT